MKRNSSILRDSQKIHCPSIHSTFTASRSLSGALTLTVFIVSNLTKSSLPDASFSKKSRNLIAGFLSNSSCFATLLPNVATHSLRMMGSGGLSGNEARIAGSSSLQGVA